MNPVNATPEIALADLTRRRGCTQVGVVNSLPSACVFVFTARDAVVGDHGELHVYDTIYGDAHVVYSPNGWRYFIPPPDVELTTT